MSIKTIIEGWRNHLIPPKDMIQVIEDVSNERLATCNGCPYNSTNAKAMGAFIMRPDEHCIQCGCTLIAKTKALSEECPIGKWKAQMTREERYELNKQINEINETDRLQTGSDQGPEGVSESAPSGTTD